MTRFDTLAARLLGRKFLHEPEVPPPTDIERALAVLAMTEAARRAARHRRAFVGGAAAAAAIALALGGAAVLNDRAVLRRGVVADATTGPGAPARLRTVEASGAPSDAVRAPGGGALAPGERIVAQGPGGVVLSSASGTGLWLEPAAELEALSVDRAQWFKLARGRVHAEVAPLSAGGRFVIETADAEVEVHGTGFEVQVVPPDPACRGGTVTRVSVGHGVVEVRWAGRHERVGADEQWPPECPRAGTVPAVRAAAPSVRATSTRPAHGPLKGRSRIEPAAAIRRSELAAQNDLFEAALAEVAAGRPQQAIGTLDRLLERWPDGPLGESAAAERLRLLSLTGDGDTARRSAREYLQRFPNGFARAQAKALAGTSP